MICTKENNPKDYHHNVINVRCATYIDLDMDVDMDMDKHFLSFRLEKLCGNSSSSSKVVSTIDTLPWKLSLDSNQTIPPYFWCHIDLYLPSDKYGLNVYIEVNQFLLLPLKVTHKTNNVPVSDGDVLYLTHLRYSIFGNYRDS